MWRLAESIPPAIHTGSQGPVIILTFLGLLGLSHPRRRGFSQINPSLVHGPSLALLPVFGLLLLALTFAGIDEDLASLSLGLSDISRGWSGISWRES